MDFPVLPGHGQTRMLLQLFAKQHAEVNGATCLHRGRPAVRRHFQSLVHRPQHHRPFAGSICADSASLTLGQEKALETDWKNRMAIRTPDMDNNILTLSGGNQQKALFARALGSDADNHPDG